MYMYCLTVIDTVKHISMCAVQSPKLKWRQRYHMLTQQELLVSELMGIMLSILNSKDDRPKKVNWFSQD